MIYVLWTVLILTAPLLAAAAVWYQKAYIGDGLQGQKDPECGDAAAAGNPMLLYGMGYHRTP